MLGSNRERARDILRRYVGSGLCEREPFEMAQDYVASLCPARAGTATEICPEPPSDYKDGEFYPLTGNIGIPLLHAGMPEEKAAGYVRNIAHEMSHSYSFSLDKTDGKMEFRAANSGDYESRRDEKRAFRWEKGVVVAFLDDMRLVKRLCRAA